MCHVHVEKNLDNHLASLDNSIIDSYKQDFKSLQLASSLQAFAKAVLLFNQKYSNDSEALQNFRKYLINNG